MAAMTDYLEGRLGDHVLNGVEFPPTTSGTVYLGLFSGAVSDSLTSGGPSEGKVDGNGYARVSVVSGWTHGPASGEFINASTLQFPTASGGSWGTISGIAVFDAISGGNALLQGLLTVAKIVDDGEAAQFASGAIQIDWL